MRASFFMLKTTLKDWTTGKSGSLKAKEMRCDSRLLFDTVPTVLPHCELMRSSNYDCYSHSSGDNLLFSKLFGVLYTQKDGDPADLER